MALNDEGKAFGLDVGERLRRTRREASSTPVPEVKTETVEEQFAAYQEERGWAGKESTKEDRKRKQFVIPKKINDRLKWAVVCGEIRNENDLINWLLEKWFAGELVVKKDDIDDK